MFRGMLIEEKEKERGQREAWRDRKSDRRDADEDTGGEAGGGYFFST